MQHTNMQYCRMHAVSEFPYAKNFIQKYFRMGPPHTKLKSYKQFLYDNFVNEKSKLRYFHGCAIIKTNRFVPQHINNAWTGNQYLYLSDDVLQRRCACVEGVRALPTMQNVYSVQYRDIALCNIAKLENVTVPCRIKDYSECPERLCVFSAASNANCFF